MKLYDRGVYLVNGNELVQDGANAIEEVRKKTGAAVIGAEAENPEETDRLSKQRKTTDTETIEEVVEVDSAAEEGTEIIEEVIEVDENGNEISREKK